MNRNLVARIRRTRSPFVTVLAGAVVLTLFGTGTAVAGSLITSARIQDGTIRSIDVRNGTLVGSDVRDGALGGADVASSSLTGADVKDGSLTNADVAVYFAQVWEDGTMSNHSGGVTATKLPSAGQYEVDFGRDLTHCAFTASVGETAGASLGEVPTVSGRSGNAEAVFVRTQTPSGTPANLAFNVIVVC